MTFRSEPPPDPDDIDAPASPLRIALQLLCLVTIATVIAVIIATTGRHELP